jgi:hypothetical protein
MTARTNNSKSENRQRQEQKQIPFGDDNQVRQTAAGKDKSSATEWQRQRNGSGNSKPRRSGWDGSFGG